MNRNLDEHQYFLVLDGAAMSVTYASSVPLEVPL